jgi:hypothetical protein
MSAPEYVLNQHLAFMHKFNPCLYNGDLMLFMQVPEDSLFYGDYDILYPPHHKMTDAYTGDYLIAPIDFSYMISADANDFDGQVLSIEGVQIATRFDVVKNAYKNGTDNVTELIKRLRKQGKAFYKNQDFYRLVKKTDAFSDFVEAENKYMGCITSKGSAIFYEKYALALKILCATALMNQS